jgi:hypothetical protein
MAALVGGFVAATTLPAAAQYVGWNDWGGGVGVSVGFGAPGFYGGYGAYPSYYAAAPSYYGAAPSYYAAPPSYYVDAPEVYAYSGPSYGVYGYAGAPAYSYGSTTIYEPGYAYGRSGYAYGRSGYVGGTYREGIRSRSYAAGGYREGVRSRSAIGSARAEVGDRTFSRGTRGTSVRSTSAARPRGSAQSASMRGNETTGRGSTSTGARGGARMQPSGMSGGASMQGGTTGQSGQMGGQPGAGR